MAHFTLDTQVVLEQYNTVREIADHVSYSSKTNPLVTPILEENTDSLFSIHLVNELKNVQDKSRVLFLAQGWNTKLIEQLLEQGITHFAIDNETDLDTFLACIGDRQVTLLLRVKLREYTLKTERYYVFGMPAEVVTKRITELPENITSGIHFHRKTQNMSEWNLIRSFEEMFDTDVLERISLLNIGGGLPAAYANTNTNVLPSILKHIKEFKEYLNSKSVQLMVEPGRFIAAPAGKLHTTITAIHDNTIIIDASIYNTDMDAVIVPVKLLIEGEKKEGTPYIIKGQTPCSVDLFRYKAYLDEKHVGDEIVFENAGAYNFASDFCDLEKLETKIS